VASLALLLEEVFPFLGVPPLRRLNGGRGKDHQGQTGEQFYSVSHDGTSHVWLVRVHTAGFIFLNIMLSIYVPFFMFEKPLQCMGLIRVQPLRPSIP
jgi:hypothetical protein